MLEAMMILNVSIFQKRLLNVKVSLYLKHVILTIQNNWRNWYQKKD